jgi:hypothetical protein
MSPLLNFLLVILGFFLCTPSVYPGAASLIIHFPLSGLSPRSHDRLFHSHREDQPNPSASRTRRLPAASAVLTIAHLSNALLLAQAGALILTRSDSLLRCGMVTNPLNHLITHHIWVPYR